MSALSHQQWDKINRFCMELYAENSSQHFFQCCLEELPTLLNVRLISWDFFDAEMNLVNSSWTSAYEDLRPAFLPVLAETMISHPVIQALDLDFQHSPLEEVYSVKDHVSHRQFRETAIYREGYRHLDIQNQLYTELSFDHGLRTGLAINSDQEITERDRETLRWLRPHLKSAYQQILKLEQARGVQTALAGSQDQFPMLTARQQEVVAYLITGLPRKLIADRMSISIHTLNGYIKEIYRVTGVHSQKELMRAFTLLLIAKNPSSLL